MQAFRTSLNILGVFILSPSGHQYYITVCCIEVFVNHTETAFSFVVGEGSLFSLPDLLLKQALAVHNSGVQLSRRSAAHLAHDGEAVWWAGPHACLLGWRPRVEAGGGGRRARTGG